MAENSFVKGLGVFEATCIVVGSMIGSGIFIAPSLMAGYIQTPGLLIGLWVLGGLLTLLATLSFSELATMFPRSGGQYHYLREAFSPVWGFSFGWIIFLVIESGFIAAVAIAFAKYLGVFFPVLGEKNVLFSYAVFGHVISFSTAQLMSILCIVVLTVINILGVRCGAVLQNIFTVAKVAAILFLVGAAFLFGSGSLAHFTPLAKPIVPAATGLGLFAALAVAMSKALFAYDSWNGVTFVAGEAKDPVKDIPRAMIWGSITVMIVYTLTTMAYMYIIPIAQMAVIPENRVGAAVAQSIMGQAGLVFITLAILISTFGCVNGLIMPGPRLYYAMARDGIFFKKMARIHPRFKTPHIALIWQGVWSCVLVFSGSYNDLLTYTAFASLFFNFLTILGLFKLRRDMPDHPRPYRVIGYPLVPLLYALVAYFFIIFIIIGDPVNSGKGIFLILIGIPIYLFWKKRKT